MARVPKKTKMTGKHLMAATMLAKGASVKEVSQSMRVTADAIYSWQRWPVFQEAQQSYIASVARAELDRGLEDAQVSLHESSGEIVKWMVAVVLGEIELKPQDKQRWRMALDMLHHAGIIDKQAALKTEQPSPANFTLNQTLAQRRQSILASGNADLAAQLERFVKPDVQRRLTS